MFFVLACNKVILDLPGMESICLDLVFFYCLFLTLFFSILLLPISSLRFLFRPKAVIGWELNFSFRDSFIASKFQYFLIILLMFGKSDCKLMLMEHKFVLTFISFLSNFSNVDIWLFRRSYLYPCSIKHEIFNCWTCAFYS